MKKFVSMIMALAMVCALSVTAFAEPYDGTLTGDTNRVVTATYSSKDTAPATVYSVEIEWTVSAGQYQTKDAAYSWDVDNLRYVKTETGEEISTDATVSVVVINKSNADVTAAVEYKDNTADTVTTNSGWTDNKDSKTAASAAAGLVYTKDYWDGTAQQGNPGTAGKAEFTTTISVDASTLSGTNSTLGTVTVTLTK